jgi:MFS family permease
LPNPHRTRIFRGWYVVGALFLGGFSLYGAGLYSFILFVTPLSSEFHWGRAATGGLVSAFWLSAPLSLWAEPLIRRFGVRRLAVTGIAIEGICLIFLFTATHLWQMYLLRALAGFGKVLYAITLPVTLSKWFSRRFGTALALMYCGWHVGGLALAPVAEQLLHLFGWREASKILGAGLLVIALPPTLWAMRVDSAADMGLGLDGAPRGAAKTIAGSPEIAAPATSYATALRQLFAIPAYRQIAVATAAYFLTYSGVLAHQAAIVEASGVSSSTASWVLGATAGFAAAGALLIGWVIDRFSLASTIAIQFVLMSVGVLALLALTHSTSGMLLSVHALCYGLAVGGSEPFWITIIRRRVPPELFQRAWGVYYFLELAFIVVGPACAGLLYDLTGAYRTALVTEAALLLVPIMLSIALARSASARPATAERGAA